jgi:hypothetical protein
MIRDIDQACTIVEAAATTGLPVMIGFTCRLGDDRQTVLLRGRDASAGGEHRVDARPQWTLEHWSGPVALRLATRVSR